MQSQKDDLDSIKLPNNEAKAEDGREYNNFDKKYGFSSFFMAYFEPKEVIEMKRWSAILMCTALVCLILVGCGASPKDGLPYFPHSDTFRLDASMKDIIEAENLTLRESEYFDNAYVRSDPVTINKYSFDAQYFANSDDTCTCIYSQSRKDKPFTEEYKAFVEYFTGLYGDDYIVDLDNPNTDIYSEYETTKWSFTGKDEVKYAVWVQITQGKMTGSYDFSILAGKE